MVGHAGDSTFNDMGDDDPETTFGQDAEKLNGGALAYLHINAPPRLWSRAPRRPTCWRHANNRAADPVRTVELTNVGVGGSSRVRQPARCLDQGGERTDFRNFMTSQTLAESY